MIKRFKMLKRVINKHQSAKLILIFLAITSTLNFVMHALTYENSIVLQDIKLNENNMDDRFVSMCSSASDNRGLHQNVVAFSVYGNFSEPKKYVRYVEPIKTTIENISRSYPGTF